MANALVLTILRSNQDNKIYVKGQIIPTLNIAPDELSVTVQTYQANNISQIVNQPSGQGSFSVPLDPDKGFTHGDSATATVYRNPPPPGTLYAVAGPTTATYS